MSEVITGVRNTQTLEKGTRHALTLFKVKIQRARDVKRLIQETVKRLVQA